VPACASTDTADNPSVGGYGIDDTVRLLLFLKETERGIDHRWRADNARFDTFAADQLKGDRRLARSMVPYRQLAMAAFFQRVPARNGPRI
jgi:hypothetical protein